MRILVLCTGNSCRSQMAEGWFRFYLNSSTGKEGHFVSSAGLEPKGVHPKAIAVMNEAGIDISGQTSDHVKQFLNDKFDYIITVCDNAAANCPTFPGPGERLRWPFDDPDKASGSEEEVTDEFRRVRDEIGDRISSWVKSLS